LKYESRHGQLTYTTGYGSAGFNLGAWLDSYRNWVKNKLTQSINCYDQAGITELALCLGILHTQLNWEFHQVYGFIDSYLVGWGPCNNPYFEGKTAGCVLGQKDPKRQPFRNHAYLSWSKEKSLSVEEYEDYNEKMKNVKNHKEYVQKAAEFETKNSVTLLMVDSCAGPAVGDESRAKYEAKIELVGETPKTSFSEQVKKNAEKFTEEHYLGSGVSHPEANAWQQQLSGEQENAFKTLMGNIKAKLNYGDLQSGLHREDVDQVTLVFQTFVGNMVSKYAWQNLFSIYVRTYSTANKTRVHEKKFSYTKMPSTNSPSGTPQTSHTASVRIALNSNLNNETGSPLIVDGCAAHLAYLALTSNINEDISSQGEISASVSGGGKVTPSVEIIGTKHRRAFVWENAAVEVYISSDDAWGADLADNTVMQMLFAKLIELQKKIS
jgi:hypothetical protein